ncbi:MAG TPA: ATP-binding protein [Rhodocyclaceae bacterium]|nr:ATP-binding protein [Rhodocyclaceae bacterium]
MEDQRPSVQLSDVLNENRETVQRDLARRLAKQEKSSALFSFLGYGPLAFLLSGIVPGNFLWGWLAVLVATEISGIAICFALQRSLDQPPRRQRLSRLLMVNLGINGSVWGSSILLPGVLEAQGVWTLLLVFISVVAIASTQVLAVRPDSLAAYTLGILAPTLLSGLFLDRMPLAIGLATAGLFVMCQLYGWTTRKQVLDSIAAELTIRKAKEAAEAANRAKSVFLSNMSHELRTPLNAILGYTQLLSRQDNLTAQQRRQLDAMHTSGEHLLTLIGDILDISKIEAQKREIAVAPFSLPRMLEQVIEIAQPKAKQKGVDLLLDRSPSLPGWVQGDESRVRQILLNLLANGIKFSPAGRVTLRARYGPEGAGTLHCEVADTGIGIPADKLETIFEPFTQLAPDAQGREGAGLGLAICRRLAALMGGSVTATSRIGQGSTFRFAIPLPATGACESAAPMARKICGYRGNRRRLLVVDDNPVNATLLSDILAPLGFEIRTAASGREALRLAQESPPDLVLLDLVMPDMDGVETAREWRRHPGLGKRPIVGVSATVTDDARKQAFSEACDAFLGKPVQLDELLQTIGRLLGLEWETADLSPAQAPAASLTPAMLAGLTPELRRHLGDAALTLDGDRIAALIPHVKAIDNTVARTLSEHVDRFDFQSILCALGEEPA